MGKLRQCKPHATFVVVHTERNAVGPLPQHWSPALHLVLPQQTLPPVMHNGWVPVVQHCCLPWHGGEHVCALSEAGLQRGNQPTEHRTADEPHHAPP